MKRALILTFVLIGFGACGGGGGKAQPDGGGDDGDDHCTNGVQDSGETDIDCGGNVGCSACANDKSCVIASDCTSGSCNHGVCGDAGCGDHVMNGTEQCDDGNQTNGDGCDNNCTTSACGNGIKAGDEECDDGNTASNDGCSADCKNEPGFTCDTANPPVCMTTCGDGIVAGTEQCDDANDDATDGCNNCMIDAGCAAGETAMIVHHTDGTAIPEDDGVTSLSSPLTGPTMGAVTKLAVIIDITHDDVFDIDVSVTGPNGITRVLAPSDGDAFDQDYTDTYFTDSATQTLGDAESPYTGSFLPSQSLSIAKGKDFKGVNGMGTWTLNVTDQFDDGETGTVNSWTLVACVDPAASYCGDGHKDIGEACDDGNTDNTDGCTTACRLPTGCGDGVIEGGEDCDDGNLDNGDGCSSTCQFDCPAGSTLVSGTNSTEVDIDDTQKDGESVINIPTLGAITGAHVTINSITAEFDDDITLSLISPTGLTRRLSTENEGDGDADFIQTVFTDNADVSILDGDAPFTGTFAPEESLTSNASADFLHHGSKGDWKLHLKNTSGFFTASIDQWSLALCVDTTIGFCGDGHTDAGEDCDDGNANNTDACPNDCRFPCGNGRIDAGEQCDDSNHTSNDGCSSTCQFDCGAGETLVSMTNTNVITIPDDTAGGASSPVTVTGAGTVSSLRVSVNSLTHGFDGDLTLSVKGPTGVERTLVSAETIFGTNFTNSVFVDSGGTITNGDAPYTGSWKPEQSLSTTSGTDFKGTAAAGTWNLHGVDSDAGATGKIHSWTLAACIAP